MSGRDIPDAEAVAAVVGPGLAGAGVEINPFVVPGLAADAVWQVRNDDLDRPLQAYVGRWPDGTLRVLSDHPEAFANLAATVGADVREPDVAIAYIEAYLEVTRGASVLVQVLRGQEDLRWRPGDEDEEARRRELLALSITPPEARKTDAGFDVELLLVVNQRVQRNTFAVAPDGSIDAAYTVIAEDLPLPIAL